MLLVDLIKIRLLWDDADDWNGYGRRSSCIRLYSGI